MQRLVICGASALEYWRCTRGAMGPREDGELPSRASRRAGDVAYLGALDVMEGLGLSAPLDVLVTEKGMRRTSSAAHYHVCKALPGEEDLEQLDSDVYVCKPGPALSQVSLTTGLVELDLLVLEFMGTYVLSLGDERGFVSTKEPLLEKDELLECLLRRKAQGSYGVGKTIQALEHAAPLSNSPMESKLHAFFSLPRRAGGLNLRGIELNSTVQLSGEARAIVGRSSIRPDFLIPEANMAGEYKSKQFHPEGTWTGDDRRIDALEAMGLHTFTLNNERVRSLKEMTAIGSTIARRLRMRKQPPSEAELAERRKLHAQLFLAAPS